MNWITPFEDFKSNIEWFVRNRQDIVQNCVHQIKHDGMEVYVLAIVDEAQMSCILRRVFDADEFLSDYGIRSLSKYHEQHPYVFGNSEVRYEPAESDNKIKGGNSNWRGPIWFPTSFLMIESLRKLGKAYGPHFSVALPDGAGRHLQNPNALVIDTHFGVDGSSRESSQAADPSHHLLHAFLERPRQPGGRDVEGFLEVGPVQGIGLVEQGESGEFPSFQDAFQGVLHSWNEVLDDEA